MADPPDVLPFEQWQIREEEDLDHATGSAQYNHMTDNLPDHAFYRLDTAEIGRLSAQISEKVISAVADAGPGDRQLLALRRSASNVAKVPSLKAKDIAAVGQQGFGKSTLINALEHCPKISKTSADGQACTASATRLSYKAGAKDLESFDAEIRFMNDLELQEVIDEHCRNYYHFHSSEKKDLDDYAECQLPAGQAEGFFRLVACEQKRDLSASTLDEYLTCENILNGALAKFTLTKAQRLIESKAGPSRMICLRDREDVKALRDEVDQFISSKNKPEHSLSPIVQMIDIKCSTLLTKHGVNICDLPGINDVDQSRTARSNATRRKAGWEMIVTQPNRVLTDNITHKYLRQSIKAHGANGTILILTRKDDILSDKQAIDESIETQMAHPFPLIKEYRASNQEEIAALKSKRGKDTQKQIKLRQAYGKYLRNAAGSAVCSNRANDLEEKMRIMFQEMDPKPIQIFSVAPLIYLQWIDDDRDEDPPMTLQQSGIPKLRKFLLQLSAQENLNVYSDHVTRSLGGLLEQCRRINEPEKLDVSFAELVKSFDQHFKSLIAHLDDVFAKFIEKNTQQLWENDQAKDDRQEDIKLNVVADWDTVHHSTYRCALQRCGIVAHTNSQKYAREDSAAGFFNWNEDIMENMRPDMDDWESRTLTSTEILIGQVDTSIEKFLANVGTSIQDYCHSEKSRSTAVHEWVLMKDRSIIWLREIRKEYRRTVASIYKYATTETDIRCLIAKLNAPHFTKVSHFNDRRGFQSLIAAQKAKMHAEIEDPDSRNRILVDRIEDAVLSKAETLFQGTFGDIRQYLIGEISVFEDHMRDRIPNATHLTERQLRQRQNVLNLLPQLENMVAQAVSQFPSSSDLVLSTQSTATDRDEAPSNTAEPEEYWAEPPRKIIKTKQTSSQNSWSSQWFSWP